MGWGAARPCESKEAKPAKIDSLFEKNFLQPPAKRFVNFCGLCAARSYAEPRGGVAREAARHFSIAGIFDKVSSSGLVNILQDLTFGFFRCHLVGGAERRPLILRLAAHGAARQAQVRNPLRFCICFALKRIFAIMAMYPTDRLLILMAVLV